MRLLIVLLATGCALNSPWELPDHEPELQAAGVAGKSAAAGSAGVVEAGQGGQGGSAGESTTAGEGGSSGADIGGAPNAGQGGDPTTAGAAGQGGSIRPVPSIWDVCPHFPDAHGRVGAGACPKDYPRFSYSCFPLVDCEDCDYRVCTFNCDQPNAEAECASFGGQCVRASESEPPTCQP